MDQALFTRYQQLSPQQHEGSTGSLASSPIPHSNKPKRARSERAELIGYFTDTLNKGLSRRPVRYAYVAMKLSHLQMRDLYYLKSICEKSSNWGKTFWGSIKVIDRQNEVD